MSIQRRSLFGIPPKPVAGSTNTTRLVPLTNGVALDQPWPLLPPGSSVSMVNYLPLDGSITPRSRLSSLNTIRTLSAINGLVERTDATGANTEIWLSGSSRHAMLNSNGSISLASFVSAFGFGTPPTGGGTVWQYAQTFFPNIGAAGNNGVVAASGSADTLLALYRATGSTGAVVMSYVTGAPRAQAVAEFDSYLVAFNITLAGQLPTRVQWCSRGNPLSGWTNEGSGFEDLLDMRGVGNAVKPLSNGRYALFTDQEIWQGIGANYPAQFQHLPLDPAVGCLAPLTIQRCDQGYIFLATDGTLRLLPEDGSKSRIVSAQVAPYLRRNAHYQSWAVYDQRTRLYHLFVVQANPSQYRGLILNVDTGAWAFADYGSNTTDSPQRGLGITLNNQSVQQHAGNEGLFFANSTGTVFSTSSLLSSDTHGSTVTSKWQSGQIGADLAGNWKQLTRWATDYRTTSRATLTLKLSTDGGNNYEATGRSVSLTSAPVGGRVETDVYTGGAFPTGEITSTSTGYEVHRIDVSMNIGGRK